MVAGENAGLRLVRLRFGYGDRAGVAAVTRHGISSTILLMGWPSAILVKMSFR
jgi:hypothetical protein